MSLPPIERRRARVMVHWNNQARGALLAGKVDKYLKQGQVLKMNGRSVSDVHTTIGNAFGIADQTFGNPAYGEGPIPTLIA